MCRQRQQRMTHAWGSCQPSCSYTIEALHSCVRLWHQSKSSLYINSTCCRCSGVSCSNHSAMCTTSMPCHTARLAIAPQPAVAAAEAADAAASEQQLKPSEGLLRTSLSTDNCSGHWCAGCDGACCWLARCLCLRGGLCDGCSALGCLLLPSTCVADSRALCVTDRPSCWMRAKISCGIA